MCGEKDTSQPAEMFHLGSPPHVRGKVTIWGASDKTTRITPACAGKRESGRDDHTAAKDHPRMCGEKDLWILTGSAI